MACINYTWPFQQRLETIDRHFRILDDSKQELLLTRLTKDVELATLTEGYTGLRIVLDKASWFLGEGEIVINLFIDDWRIFPSLSHLAMIVRPTWLLWSEQFKGQMLILHKKFTENSACFSWIKTA